MRAAASPALSTGPGTHRAGEPEGWPGVFRRLRHDIPRRPRRIEIRGIEFTFATCGSACVPPTDLDVDRPWCPACRPTEMEYPR